MSDVGGTSSPVLAQLAIAELTRRLDDYDRVLSLVNEYSEALTRAAQLIDFATDRQINPKSYEGEIKKMYRAHCEWIEKQRAKGLFPPLHGTHAPVARPKRSSK